MDKPSLPKGTRDFGPAQMARRQYLMETIRQVFRRYGFLPLETPAMENLSTLTGKYGEEGDQLLFKILNSGDFLKDLAPEKLQVKDSRKITPDISEKGLRYDLTVPFARYVVMNRHEIALPFKRYQMQPVWRADRPQKGRYREFYQCDADVVGTDSLICEAEIIGMITEVFAQLNLKEYSIKINHRGVLSGLAELAGVKEKETSLFVAIDKLEKIGEKKVREELIAQGFANEQVTTAFDVLTFSGRTEEKLKFLRAKFTGLPTGTKGVDDLTEVFRLLDQYGISSQHVDFDLALARGLSYYTGCIFEVKIHGVAIGSVSGGGRYDNLTQAFGSKERLSGVGISFGIDRIYDALDELKLFPESAQTSTRVLVCHFDEATRAYGLPVVKQLREKGVATEIYPDITKVKKQLEYADRKRIAFAVVIGADEMASGQLTVKNLATGEQQKKTIDELVASLAS